MELEKKMTTEQIDSSTIMRDDAGFITNIKKNKTMTKEELQKEIDEIVELDGMLRSTHPQIQDVNYEIDRIPYPVWKEFATDSNSVFSNNNKASFLYRIERTAFSSIISLTSVPVKIIKGKDSFEELGVLEKLSNLF